MFTGIIEFSAKVSAAEQSPVGRSITLQHAWTDLRHGESIAVNGVCLTVAALDASTARFDVIGETLEKTNLGLVAAGDAVHVERSLRVGDRIDGHFVQGHVDGVAKLLEIKSDPADWRLTIEVPPFIEPYIVTKGAITIDGVSLTIAAVHDHAFEVALIPTTLQITQLGHRKIGWPFNLEADIFAKTIVSFLERRRASGRDVG